MKKGLPSQDEDTPYDQKIGRPDDGKCHLPLSNYHYHHTTWIRLSLCWRQTEATVSTKMPSTRPRAFPASYRNVVVGAMMMVKSWLYAGISSFYNFIADSDLLDCQVAARRIPCACKGCFAQQALKWVPGTTPKKQPRYSKG
jgi:hypothetical protein